MAGLRIETECKNLRELNAQLRMDGEDYHYIYCGFMTSANGYQERMYLCEDDEGRTYGDYFCIDFNSRS